MQIKFFSVLLLCSLCQVFSAAIDTQTGDVNNPSKGSSRNVFKRCCDTLRLGGENSMFKDLVYKTGTDYTPPSKRSSGQRRRCCHGRHHGPPTSNIPAEPSGATQIGMTVAAYDLGRAQGENGSFVPAPSFEGVGSEHNVSLGGVDTSGATYSAAAPAVDVSAVAGAGGGSTGGGGGCGCPADDAVANCFCQALNFLCSDVLCCCCKICENCDGNCIL